MGGEADAPQVLTVGEDQGGRADLFVRQHFPDLGRRELARLFEDGRARRGGVLLKKGTALVPGDVVELRLQAGAYELIADPDLELSILLADESIVAVSKPSGVPSHALRRGERGTVANALAAHFPDTRGVGDDPREGGLVHRLDTETTGALLAARSRAAWLSLRDQFRGSRVVKTYLALVHGRCAAGGSDEPLEMRGKRATPRPGGLPASSRWELVEELGQMTLLRVTAMTGRTHQVRAHLAHAGHPLAGDVLYGAPGHLPGGHFLHSETLQFEHPATGATTRIDAPIPEQRRQTLEALREQRRG